MSNTNYSDFTTPEGRFLNGTVDKPYTTDFNKQPCDPHWSLKIALPKSNPETAAFIEKIRATATAGAAEAGNPALLQRPDFSYKFVDGDTGCDMNGQPYSEKEGYPGHYVVHLFTKQAFVLVDQNRQPILDASKVYCGCYIRVGGTMCFNPGDKGKPSVQLYLNGVQFMREGEALGRQKASAEDMFGPAPAAASIQPHKQFVENAGAGHGLTLTAKGQQAGINIETMLASGMTGEQMAVQGWVTSA